MKKIIYLFTLLPLCLWGQQTTQTISLQPGWNSVYLEVAPSPAACSEALQDVPVKSVWAWAKQFNAQSESGLDWLIYNPSSEDLTDLYQLQGGKSYLIEVKGSEAIEWTITGKPVLPSMSWQADTLSLAGFHVDADNAPTFTEFFSAAPELLNNQVLQMDTEGKWSPVTNLETATIQKGTSYWVQCDKFSKFAAPITLETAQENCLAFGSSLNSQSLTIRNNAPFVKQVQLKAVAANNSPDQLGTVALTYLNAATGQMQALANKSVSIPAQSSLTLTIGIDRTQMRAGGEGSFQSLLEVNDGEGTQFFLPVSSTNMPTSAGLWSGYAVIDRVSEVNGVSETPLPTASEFQLRLIVHVDDSGNARLLDQVTQMWQEGTYKSDPNDPSKLVVDEPGKYVLITDESLMDQYTGATVRDGKAVGRRMSSSHFSFDRPQSLSGVFEDELGIDNLILDYDDPLNPFKHTYHPNHNNLDERYENALPEGQESYTINRSIQLSFTADDPEGLTLEGYGDNMVGGNYRETISGVHRQAIHVAGKFRLRRVSNISRLNEVPPNRPSINIANVAATAIEIRKEEDTKSIVASSLTLSPNPVVEEFQINGLKAGTYQLSIWDANGKLVRQANIQGQAPIVASDLAAGSYTIEVKDETSKHLLKLIKQRL